VCTCGAKSPVGNFGFIDDEAVCFRCSEAWTMTYSAINIGNLATSTTDDVMMIIAYTTFVQCG
jgi:hypothetical protein